MISFLLLLVQQPALIDDFEKVRPGLGWYVMADDQAGGRSAVTLSRSSGTLRFSGTPMESPRAFAGLWVPIDTLARSCDITAFTGVRFRARGSGEFHAGIRGVAAGPSFGYVQPFTADAGWQEVAIGFESLRPRGVPGVPNPADSLPLPLQDTWGFTIQHHGPGEFLLELDEVTLVGAPGVSLSAACLHPAWSTGSRQTLVDPSRAGPPRDLAWRGIADDSLPDPGLAGLPDARRVSVATDEAGHRVWFRIELWKPAPEKWLGATVALDDDGNPSNGGPWWGRTPGFRYDRVVSAYLNRSERGWQGFVGVADPAGGSRFDFTNLTTDVAVAFDGDRTVLLGVPMTMFSWRGTYRALFVVGSSLVPNDEVMSGQDH